MGFLRSLCDGFQWPVLGSDGIHFTALKVRALSHYDGQLLKHFE